MRSIVTLAALALSGTLDLAAAGHCKPHSSLLSSSTESIAATGTATDMDTATGAEPTTSETAGPLVIKSVVANGGIGLRNPANPADIPGWQVDGDATTTTGTCHTEGNSNENICVAMRAQGASGGQKRATGASVGISQWIYDLNTRTPYTIRFFYAVVTYPAINICEMNAYLGNQRFYQDYIISMGVGVQWNVVLRAVTPAAVGAPLSITMNCWSGGVAMIYVDSIFMSNQVTPQNIDNFVLDYNNNEEAIVPFPTSTSELPLQSTTESQLPAEETTNTEWPAESSAWSSNGLDRTTSDAANERTSTANGEVETTSRPQGQETSTRDWDETTSRPRQGEPSESTSRPGQGEPAESTSLPGNEFTSTRREPAESTSRPGEEETTSRPGQDFTSTRPEPATTSLPQDEETSIRENESTSHHGNEFTTRSEPAESTAFPGQDSTSFGDTGLETSSRPLDGHSSRFESTAFSQEPQTTTAYPATTTSAAPTVAPLCLMPEGAQCTLKQPQPDGAMCQVKGNNFQTGWGYYRFVNSYEECAAVCARDPECGAVGWTSNVCHYQRDALENLGFQPVANGWLTWSDRQCWDCPCQAELTPTPKPVPTYTYEPDLPKCTNALANGCSWKEGANYEQCAKYGHFDDFEYYTVDRNQYPIQWSQNWCVAICRQMPTRCKSVAFIGTSCRFSRYSVQDAKFNPSGSTLHWDDNYWHDEDSSCFECPECNDPESESTTAAGGYATSTSAAGIDVSATSTRQAYTETFATSSRPETTEEPTMTRDPTATDRPITSTQTMGFMPLCTLALSDGCDLNSNWDPSDPNKCARNGHFTEVFTIEDGEYEWAIDGTRCAAQCWHMPGRCKASASDNGRCYFSAHGISHSSFTPGNEFEVDLYWQDQSCLKCPCGRDPEYVCPELDDLYSWANNPSNSYGLCADLYDGTTPPAGLICEHTGVYSHHYDLPPDGKFPTENSLDQCAAVCKSNPDCQSFGWSEELNRCLVGYKELKDVTWGASGDGVSAVWSDTDCWSCPMCFDRMEWRGD
ncbi:hypothetical protein ACJ41O_011136 [Fusarium nematophilum]